MLFTKSTLLTACAIAFAHAQSSSFNSTADISGIDGPTRASYCNGQINTCGQLCDGRNGENTCNTVTLDFECTCASNSSEPGLRYYKQTIPYYLCELEYAQCISTNANNAAGQRACTSARQENCGTLDAEDLEDSDSSSGSSSSSATSTPSRSSSGSPSQTQDSDTANATETDNLGSMLMMSTGNTVFGLLVASVFGYLL